AAWLHDDTWPARAENCCLPDDGSHVREVPTMAFPRRRFRKITPSRIRSAMKSGGSASRSLAAKAGRRSLRQKIAYFLEKEAFTWDFCLFDSRLHKRFFRYIDQNLSVREMFVLIGHPKGYTSDRQFVLMLSRAKALGYLYSTLQALASKAVADKQV